MANFKIVISDPKTRKAYQKEVDQVTSGLMGKRIGEKIPGNNVGLEGYTIEITGGSDNEGFPMRKDVEGSGRKKIVLSHGTGYHAKRSGGRKRKSIRGNTVSKSIVQINVKVSEHGKKSIEELFGVKKEEKAEEKPKEEETKETPKEEVKKEEPKAEEKPKEEKKEAPKEEKKEDTAEKAEKKMGVKKLE